VWLYVQKSQAQIISGKLKRNSIICKVRQSNYVIGIGCKLAGRNGHILYNILSPLAEWQMGLHTLVNMKNYFCGCTYQLDRRRCCLQNTELTTVSCVYNPYHAQILETKHTVSVNIKKKVNECLQLSTETSWTHNIDSCLRMISLHTNNELSYKELN
jgi:hypothetical protein